MAELRAHGIAVALPPGWEGAIFRRRVDDASTAYPVCHLATFALPPERGDFGHGAVDLMGPNDVFIALFEFGPESVGAALFAEAGFPTRLGPGEFDPAGMARTIPGMAGVQRFFHHQGRAFSLYVVLGSYGARHVLVPTVNAVLATIAVAAPRVVP